MTIKVKRLSRLADLLENYREGPGTPAFSLDEWGETEVHRRGFLWLEKVECHTQACAVGLACLSGAFSADGLSWSAEGGTIIPRYRGLREWSAVHQFFGLSRTQTLKLFDGNDYDGPINGPEAAKAVAAHIRALIERKSKRARKSKTTTQRVEEIKAAALAGAGKSPVGVT